MGYEASRYAKTLRDLAPEHPFEVLSREFRPGNTVLDIGCGSGEVGAYLATNGVIVDGVEPNEERARVASDKLRKVLIGLPLEVEDRLDDHYDGAIFIDVIEHIVDPLPVLQWAARKATRVYSFIPNAAYYPARIKILRGDWSYKDAGIFDRDHVRFYDLRTMKELVTAAGLRCVTFRPFLSGPRHVPKRLLKPWPGLFSSAVLIRIER